MIFQEDVEPRDFTYYYLSQTRGSPSTARVALSNTQLAPFGETRSSFLIDSLEKESVLFTFKLQQSIINCF